MGKASGTRQGRRPSIGCDVSHSTLWRRRIAYPYAMTGISKFVALVLMVAALAWPAAAVTTCWTHSDAGGSDMKCPPGCPMMARQSAKADRVSAESQGAPCCKFSSGKSAPASVPQLPVSTSQAGAVVLKTTVSMAVAVQPQHRATSLEATAPDLSPQAVLCTFLI